MSNSLVSSMHPRNVFAEWYHSSPQGLSLQRLETAFLSNLFKLTHNQIILQVGYLGGECLYIKPETVQGIVCPLSQDILPSIRPMTRFFHASPEALPIASDSIDCMLLPHVLEFYEHPRVLLQECQRILRPEGDLYVLGFNPWHLQGLLHCIPTQGNYHLFNWISYKRLAAWLRTERMEAQFSAGFTLNNPRTLLGDKTIFGLSLARLAPVYALHAVKRRYNVLPLEPVWKLYNPLIAAPSMESACPMPKRSYD